MLTECAQYSECSLVDPNVFLCVFMKRICVLVFILAVCVSVRETVCAYVGVHVDEGVR